MYKYVDKANFSGETFLFSFLLHMKVSFLYLVGKYMHADNYMSISSALDLKLMQVSVLSSIFQVLDYMNYSICTCTHMKEAPVLRGLFPAFPKLIV